MERLPYLECFPNGRNSPRAPACVEENITSYPTWIVNGQRYGQILAPERLAQLSNFTGPTP